MTMSKRTIATIAGGVLAGAALVGVPAYAASTTPGDESAPHAEAHTSDMGAMMSDPQFRQEMKDFMSEMMSDPELTEQMRSMMSEAMPDMHGMEGSEDMGGMHGMGGGGMSDHEDHGTEQDQTEPATP